MYTDHQSKVEDTRSTGWTFTIVGILGILLVILLDMDVLPVSMQLHTRIILSVVMGILFVIFLIIGIHSFLSIRTIQEAADRQSSEVAEITEWFLDNYRDEMLSYQDDSMDASVPASLYYPRCEKMSVLLTIQYPGLSEELKDDIIEILYNKIFPENE